MSLRKASAVATAATVAAFGLVLSLPGAASAATGTFSYSYADPATGQSLRGALIDPPGATCVELPQADTPANDTDKTVVMFADAGCTGLKYYVLNPMGKATSRLKLRSVEFS